MKKRITGFILSLITVSAMAGDSICPQSNGNSCHYLNQSEARTAVSRGDVRAYSKLEGMISTYFKGRIIRVELEEEDDEWVYEIRLLMDDGRVIKVWVDATYLQILEVEGHRLESVIKKT